MIREQLTGAIAALEKYGSDPVNRHVGLQKLRAQLAALPEPAQPWTKRERRLREAIMWENCHDYDAEVEAQMKPKPEQPNPIDIPSLRALHAEATRFYASGRIELTHNDETARRWAVVAFEAFPSLLAELKALRAERDRLRSELAEARRDGERLDWMEKQLGSGLISDDFGHWSVSGEGMQNVPKKTPADIQTTFFVEAANWCKSVRAAIDAARGAK